MRDYGYGYQHRQRQQHSHRLLKLVFALAGILLFTLAIAHGIDTTLENQDRMNCRSAKVSGNEEWLAKCQCFYTGEKISCIQGKEGKP